MLEIINTTETKKEKIIFPSAAAARILTNNVKEKTIHEMIGQVREKILAAANKGDFRIHFDTCMNSYVYANELCNFLETNGYSVSFYETEERTIAISVNWQ